MIGIQIEEMNDRITREIATIKFILVHPTTFSSVHVISILRYFEMIKKHRNNFANILALQNQNAVCKLCLRGKASVLRRIVRILYSIIWICPTFSLYLSCIPSIYHISLLCVSFTNFSCFSYVPSRVIKWYFPNIRRIVVYHTRGKYQNTTCHTHEPNRVPTLITPPVSRTSNGGEPIANGI